MEKESESFLTTEEVEEIGKENDLILLRKLRIKRGHTSGVKPGSRNVFLLYCPINIGSVMKKMTQRGQKNFGIVRSIPKSSLVVKISPKKNNEEKFIVETITSFYEVEFL